MEFSSLLVHWSMYNFLLLHVEISVLNCHPRSPLNPQTIVKKAASAQPYTALH